MLELKLDRLLTSSIKDIKKHINEYFNLLLENMKTVLELPVTNENIEIVPDNYKRDEIINSENIFHIGVSRRVENGKLFIKIYDNFDNFIPIILLRETFYLFIPHTLKQNKLALFGVNSIIESILDTLKCIDDWKVVFRENLLNEKDEKDLNSLYPALPKLINKEKPRKFIKFYFNYLQKNSSFLSDEISAFYKPIFDEFATKSFEMLYSDEIIETVRVLISLFWKVKRYDYLLDYQNFFKKFTEVDEIKTELSLKKFTANMQWISKNTFLSPSYQLNWKAINVDVGIIFFKFYPHINFYDAFELIQKFPFLLGQKSVLTSFSAQFITYFVIPHAYIEDLKAILGRMKSNGYLIDFYLGEFENYIQFLNLNYFREIFDNRQIINQKYKDYERKYEIEFQISFYEKFLNTKLSLLDFFILDRIRFYNISGFNFERRENTLIELKSDLMNEIIFQKHILKNLESTQEIILNSEEIRKDFIKFIEKNRRFGFFYIQDLLKKYIISLKAIQKICEDNKSIRTANHLYFYLDNNPISSNFEQNLSFNDVKIKTDILRNMVPLIFNSYKKYNEELQKYQIYHNFFSICQDLKIYSLKTIRDMIIKPELIEEISYQKEQKLDQISDELKITNITTREVDNRLTKFLENEPAIIAPQLINTFYISHFVKFFLALLLRNSTKAWSKIEELRRIFPSTYCHLNVNLNTNKKYIDLEIGATDLSSKERRLLLEIIQDTFKDEIIYAYQIFYPGYFPAFSIKQFYDLYNKQFFYTPSLFEEFYRKIRVKLKPSLHKYEEKDAFIKKVCWKSSKSLEKLYQINYNRVIKQSIHYDSNDLNTLTKFSQNLDEILQNIDEFIALKNKPFFSQHIKAIKLTPDFGAFGFEQYFFYFKPFDTGDIDFRLLLLNSFSSLKLSYGIGENPLFFIKYLFPLDTPNKSYINWLLLSKKAFAQYCFFKPSKMHIILKFDTNMDSEGWSFDITQFKNHAQRVLFEKSYNFPLTYLKTFNFSANPLPNFLGPDSNLFQDLTTLYNYKSIDIKSLKTSTQGSTFAKLANLLKKGHLCTHLKLKNLGLMEKLIILLPNVNPDNRDTLIKVFYFFNVAKIYEIDGDYYILSFNNPISFKHGLMINLYLPSIDLSGFIEFFSQVFNYIKIDNYLILNHHYSGKSIIKHVFKTDYTPKYYNPLQNFAWNESDKKWMNEKLFDESFIPKYPDLKPKDRGQA